LFARRLTAGLAPVIPVAVVAVLASGCSLGDDPLTIYSGRTENLVGPILEEFTEETGIDVEVRYGDSADLALLIEEEGERSPADVFLSQSPGAVGFLAGEDLLAPLSQESLDLVDPRYRSAGGDWVGFSGRVRVLVYNSELVEQADLPESVFDLTDPAYEDVVALAPANGSFQDFVTAMRETQGDDVAEQWLSDMADNGAVSYADNTSIVQAVGRGEIPMGLVNHYYNYRAKAEDPDIPSENHVFCCEDVGSLLITTGAAVPAASDDERAEELVRFLLGEQAQIFFSEETFEYPLAAGVQPATVLPPLASLDAATFDPDQLGGGLERTKELIDASGLETI
jgi:iron(III) transport system substrate-binding protein